MIPKLHEHSQMEWLKNSFYDAIKFYILNIRIHHKRSLVLSPLEAISILLDYFASVSLM